MAVTITSWDVRVGSDSAITMMRTHAGLVGADSTPMGSKAEHRGFFPKDYADAAAMAADMDTKLTPMLAPTMTAQQITDFATELVRVAFAFAPEP